VAQQIPPSPVTLSAASVLYTISKVRGSKVIGLTFPPPPLRLKSASSPARPLPSSSPSRILTPSPSPPRRGSSATSSSSPSPSSSSSPSTSPSSTPPPPCATPPPSNTQGGESLADRIVSLCLRTLAEPAITRDAAAQVVAKFVVRPDAAARMDALLRWASDALSTDNPFLVAPPCLRSKNRQRTGALSAAAAAFRAGMRTELAARVDFAVGIVRRAMKDDLASLQMKLSGASLVT
jgi:hypothetical protein